MKNEKIYALTMGKTLYYVARDYEEAELEKQMAEEENWQGRKQNIKLSTIDMNELTSKGSAVLKNGVEYTSEDILRLL